MAQLKYFEGDLWLLDGLTWTNLSSKTKTAKAQDTYIKGMIRAQLISDGMNPDYVDGKVLGAKFSRLMQESTYNNNTSVTDINTDVIVTRNKLVNLNTGTIDMLTPHNIPFTPYQIGVDLPESPIIFAEGEAKPEHPDVALAKRFMKELTQGDKDMERLLYEIIGTSMAPRNESIFPVLYSPHKSSGKGTIMDIIGNLNGLTREIKGEKWWNEGNNFSLSSIRNQLVGWIDEVPANLPKASTEKIKSYSDDKKYLEIERKGIDQERMLNTTTFIATTNHKTELYSVDDSIQGRMMWIEFGMNLYGKPKFTKREIETLKNSKESLAYFANEGIKAYLEVLKRPGTRKERYTQVKSDARFWSGIQDQSIATEIITYNKTTAALWDAKETFLTNLDLKEAFDDWKLDNRDSKISFKGFQNELIAYIHANKLGKADRHTIKNIRGIQIDWAAGKNDDPYILNSFGDMVKQSEWDSIMNKQAEEDSKVQSFIKE